VPDDESIATGFFVLPRGAVANRHDLRGQHPKLAAFANK